MLSLILLQLVIPSALLLWFAIGRHANHASWLIRFVAVAGYLVALASAGLWLTLPPHLLLGYVGLFVVATAVSFRGWHNRGMWPLNRRERFGLATAALLAVTTIFLAAYTLGGRSPAAAPMVDLVFPLGSGTYYVANGGSRTLLNAHLAALETPRLSSYRGQSYGLDLIKLGPAGLRAHGLAPRDPTAYAVFGETVRAPCSGTVVLAVDGLIDLSPPAVDRDHLAGNHVLLDCGDVWILLGHLEHNSVCVALGDSVTVGEAIGRVGNTGNTDEPHLHVHAQRPGSSDTPFDGEPLQVRFDGRYLARNALVRIRR
jgi:hypothetical protein